MFIQKHQQIIKQEGVTMEVTINQQGQVQNLHSSLQPVALDSQQEEKNLLDRSLAVIWSGNKKDKNSLKSNESRKNRAHDKDRHQEGTKEGLMTIDHNSPQANIKIQSTCHIAQGCKK
jgi:hypothetical protein